MSLEKRMKTGKAVHHAGDYQREWIPSLQGRQGLALRSATKNLRALRSDVSVGDLTKINDQIYLFLDYLFVQLQMHHTFDILGHSSILQ